MVAMDVDGEIADDPSDSFLTLTLSLPVKATALHLQALSADGPLYLFTGQSKGLIQGTPIESSLQTDREEGEEDEEEIEFPFKPFRVQVAHQDADRHSILALSTGSLFTAYDTIAGDADGLLVVLSRGHVLQKFEAGGPVMCVLQLEDGLDDQIIVGDFHGKITCFQGTERYWALNLPPSPKSTEYNRSIQTMITYCHTDPQGLESLFIVAADGSPFVHFILNGLIVRSVPVETSITAMCVWSFLSDKDSEQIAMGGRNGAIYLMDDFQVTPFIQTEFAITCLATLDSTPDILCVGTEAPSLSLYSMGSLICQKETPNAIKNIATDRGFMALNTGEEVLVFRSSTAD